jgi:outer membrane lipoprotein LolB
LIRLLLLWLVVLLGGCSLLPPAPTPVARPAHAVSAAFALNGRIAINHRGQRHFAGLRWTHQAQSDEVLLLAPLGQTAARVYRVDGNATLDNGDKHYSAKDAESLMEQALGWHLPLNGLHHWVLGLATESPARIKRDGNGQISVLHQDGWEVRYLRYNGTEPDSMPTRLQLSRDDLQIQLLIDEWEWNPL